MEYPSGKGQIEIYGIRRVLRESLTLAIYKIKENSGNNGRVREESTTTRTTSSL